MWENISVVLNAYRRTKYLSTQLQAIELQTIKPTEILLWHNAGEDIDPRLCRRVVVASCNHNLGVWARFAYALNAKGDYICLLDDDTIPGIRWFENCLRTMKTHEGLLGTRGVRFLAKGRYTPIEDVGWRFPNEQVERVDIVGHSWFFKREWLSTFWRELPPDKHSLFVGEDMHFSYTLQKFLGLSTYVPPHPKSDLELWGSLPEFGNKFGQEGIAISMQPETITRFNEAWKYYEARGFKLTLNALDRSRKAGFTIGSGVQQNSKLRSILEPHPRIFKYAKSFRKFLTRIKVNV